MKVSDLIALLEPLDPDTEVFVTHGGILAAVGDVQFQGARDMGMGLWVLEKENPQKDLLVLL